jgi:hypothetical protein
MQKLSTCAVRRSKAGTVRCRLRPVVAVLAAICSSGAATAARAAVVSSVQTGTAVSSADGTLTVPISAVDPTRSVLFFQIGNDSTRPPASMLLGRLASATTLEFVRPTNEATPAPITIRWYVAEFASGVRVQRGEVDQSATVLNVPIAAVGAVDRAFVLWSKTALANHQNNYDGDDPAVGELTSPTNLQFRVDTARAGITIGWQVVEFTSPGDVRVQKGSTSLTGGALSVDVTLAPADAVDVSSTFLLLGYTVSGSGNDIGARMLRARLMDSTTIRIDRGLAGNADDIPEIHWQAVELRDGSEVVRGSASLAAGVGQVEVGLGGRKVDLGGAVAFSATQAVGGQSTGITAFATDDVPGVCSVTAGLAASSLTLTRANTASACDVGWFAVQFAPTLTTAVTLTSLTATPADGSVRLDWETGAEVNNLGFHVYRGASGGGPWTRLTANLVPGLGSSPEGARYSFDDVGLVNGSTYFYVLEDVETTGRTKRHGPVSATPRETAVAPRPSDPEPPRPAAGWRRYGDPEATSLTVVERTASHAVLELRTGGFHARPDGTGAVRLSIPGFDVPGDSGAPALPVRLAWLEAIPGRRVELVSAVEGDVVSYERLRPAVGGEHEVRVGPDGSVVARTRRVPEGASFRAPGLYPARAARLRSVAFQGDVKKALVELAPLRWDTLGERLVLARRVRVRVAFSGKEPGERSFGGGRGLARTIRRPLASHGVAARLATRERGLHAVGYEQLFGARDRGLSAAGLRLSRRGATVAHHLEPEGPAFGPGSVLYFVGEDPSLEPELRELVYELSFEGGGRAMAVADVEPIGPSLPFAWSSAKAEVDRIYQPGLLQAESVWLWDAVTSPAVKSYPVSLTGPVAGEPAALVVWLQGGSDFPGVADHHVRVSLNDAVVGEASWDGQTPHRLEARVPPGVLAEGENHLSVENVGDAGASHSLVFLDRFELRFARQPAAGAGRFEGWWSEPGAARIDGLPLDAVLLDTTDGDPRWLVNARREAAGTRLRVEPGRRILAAGRAAAWNPEVRLARVDPLTGLSSGSDYVVLGPRSLIAEAEPLLEQRRAQGLHPIAVAVEDVYDQFGFGEARPGAVRGFLEHAFHRWRRAPRYVLLLGDASYDFKDNLRTGAANHVPPYMIRDAYLRTVSDPAYAAVNGEDALPDLAIGRLPARSAEEARALIAKVLEWERASLDLSGRAVLVADDADAAGDFEGDSEEAALLMADRDVERIYLSREGGSTRALVAAAFDAGASLMSYLGHGGVAVWASENVWNNWDAAGLAPQPEQPVLLAMDCLNGYFHNPSLNALAEELLKAEGRGVIAAVAPSSLSVHWAAKLYHQALVRELASGRHERLGDAILAAQAAYLESGARPDLLRTYQLLADPGLRIRR